MQTKKISWFYSRKHVFHMHLVRPWNDKLWIRRVSHVSRLSHQIELYAFLRTRTVSVLFYFKTKYAFIKKRTQPSELWCPPAVYHFWSFFFFCSQTLMRIDVNWSLSPPGVDKGKLPPQKKFKRALLPWYLVYIKLFSWKNNINIL